MVEDPEFVIISVTQAFCPEGHALIGPQNPAFYGMPGLTVRVRSPEHTEDVTLSAVHGDPRKSGGDTIPDGTRCEILCPECETELAKYEEACRCGQGDLHLIYLTPDRNPGDVAMLCDVWGCYRSRVVDKWELLSEFIDSE